jgi:hypothetical protein
MTTERSFDDGLFDRVTSRLAAMYFADYLLAFREARRVLKPGGQAVYLAWGRFEQPMFAEIIGVLFKYVSAPSEDPDAPTPFRFSRPGTLSTALEQAGFDAVLERTVTAPTTFLGDPQHWWEWLCDTAAPMQAWLAEMDVATRRQALDEVLAAPSAGTTTAGKSTFRSRSSSRADNGPDVAPLVLTRPYAGHARDRRFGAAEELRGLQRTVPPAGRDAVVRVVTAVMMKPVRPAPEDEARIL